MKLPADLPDLLPPSFYEGDDVVGISRKLIGKTLVSRSKGHLTAGRIVETEAYRAPEDKASHAFAGRRSPKNEDMYGPPGTSYVYICYGIHFMFNISTGPVDLPHAILIRALAPLRGMHHMTKRRGVTKERLLTSGPGKLCQAMAIDKTHGGHLVYHPDAIVTVHECSGPPVEDILSGPRIGLTTAAEWTDTPWRFWEANNPFVSR